MRLIETTTLAMETHEGNIPRYAILSHTWEDEEVTLQDWNSPTRDRMKGFHKIRMTCRLAAYKRIKYAWVDTCCIDKTNSAELSEAINSMYRWYKGAHVCYAYLSDLHLPKPTALEDYMDMEGSMDSKGSMDSEGFMGSAVSPESDEYKDLKSSLRACRWFYRGWTLQELIAPCRVLFYDRNWGLVGNKAEWSGMLSDITGISLPAMYQYDPADYTIAERMSWAAERETTREEDRAYCLLGIFNVNMPMLYGEGTKAFRRLQEEIIRTGYDVSIFAWTKTLPSTKPEWRHDAFSYSAFADTPGEFLSIPAANLVRSHWNEVNVTNAGVKLALELCLVRTPLTGMLSYVLPVSVRACVLAGKGSVEWQASTLGVKLQKISRGRFVRNDVEKLVEIPGNGEADMVRRIHHPDAYILINPPHTIASNLKLSGQHRPCFLFPSGCQVAKAWPSGSWNYAEHTFMTFNEGPQHGSLLLEVQFHMLTDDSPTRLCRTGEFMFLFSSLPGCEDQYDPCVEGSRWDLQYTIVGYREHQLTLDNISLRMEAGDIDAWETRRSLRNFAIPKQRTAVVLAEGTRQQIYISVELMECEESEFSYKYVFRRSSVPLENEQQPGDV